MRDRYIDDECPSTCPNYKRQSESIAEYQRIEKELQAKVEDLRRGLNDIKGMYKIARKERTKLYAKVEELEGDAYWKEISNIQADEYRNELEAEIEAQTRLVASLEEVRAKEYALKQAKVEEMEQAIGYVLRAWYNDRPHLPWSIHQLEKTYPNWKDRYPTTQEKKHEPR